MPTLGKYLPDGTFIRSWTTNKKGPLEYVDDDVFLGSSGPFLARVGVREEDTAVRTLDVYSSFAIPLRTLHGIAWDNGFAWVLFRQGYAPPNNKDSIIRMDLDFVKAHSLGGYVFPTDTSHRGLCMGRTLFEDEGTHADYVESSRLFTVNRDENPDNIETLYVKTPVDIKTISKTQFSAAINSVNDIAHLGDSRFWVVVSGVVGLVELDGSLIDAWVTNSGGGSGITTDGTFVYVSED